MSRREARSAGSWDVEETAEGGGSLAREGGEQSFRLVSGAGVAPKAGTLEGNGHEQATGQMQASGTHVGGEMQTPQTHTARGVQVRADKPPR